MCNRHFWIMVVLSGVLHLFGHKIILKGAVRKFSLLCCRLNPEKQLAF